MASLESTSRSGEGRTLRLLGHIFKEGGPSLACCCLPEGHWQADCIGHSGHNCGTWCRIQELVGSPHCPLPSSSWASSTTRRAAPSASSSPSASALARLSACCSSAASPDHMTVPPFLPVFRGGVFCFGHELLESSRTLPSFLGLRSSQNFGRFSRRLCLHVHDSFILSVLKLPEL